ncbi:hypothetical protein EV715DRAFT_215556, partial [Schizophyllum commune]
QSLFCFLHSSNRLIGDISSYPPAKAIIKQTTAIVTFFNGSHYWGGQLKQAAEAVDIKARSLKQNCESRWYAVTLQGLSVSSLR